MASLRWRWANGPDDQPADGEAVARLSIVAGSGSAEAYPGVLQAPSLVFDRAAGELVPTEPRAIDLSVTRYRFLMTVTAAGRELVVRFDPEADAPLIPEGADDDLVYALRQAWRDRPGPGRPPEQAGRIAAIEAAADELGDAATRLRVAQHVGGVDRKFGLEETGQYKEDVRAAGGWEAIMEGSRARRGLSGK